MTDTVTRRLPLAGAPLARLGALIILGWIIVSVVIVATAPKLSPTSDQSEFLPSKYESINNDIRFYLEQGMSLSDAQRAAIDMGHAQLRAAALLVAGFDESAMLVLERQEERLKTGAQRMLEMELNADRAAVEQAVREDVARPRARSTK